LTLLPLVSIVMPVFNGSDYLREAIDSALAQTYPNVEIIVVNDGSDDDGKTREIALSYGAAIVYLEKENGGVATALNMGIQAAHGKYISWLSHDDAYLPNKLERQVPVLERLVAEGKKAVAYSSFIMMDERSVDFGLFEIPNIPPSEVFGALLCQRVFTSPFRSRAFGLNGCTLLIPRNAFLEVGWFDTSLPTTQDYDLWFRMLGVFDFVKVDGYLIRSRIHKGQGTYVLRKDRVDEVEDMLVRAFRMYRPGSARYDLDVARTVLALKRSMRMRAYVAAREELRKQRLSLRSLSYVFRSMLLTRSSVRVRNLFGYGMRRIAWSMAKKNSDAE
jgi:glycosyltransferase involved in cell wall biosynthesis